MQRRIRLPGDLCDFGLAPYTRGLRDRLAVLGYRLARHRWYWRVYKSFLGGPDVFMNEFGNLSALEGWLKDLEHEKAHAPHAAGKF